MAPTRAQQVAFYYSQFFVTPPRPTRSCAGKTICVTGANSGLGKECARHYVGLGAAKVILGCRNIEAADTAKKDIESSTGRTGVVDVYKLDMVDYPSIKAFAKTLDALDRLDIVILNAGINTRKFKRGPSGEELTITTNVIGTYYLALLLLPTLSRSAKVHSITPVLDFVSSEVHAWTDLPERKYLPSNPATANSKTPLFDILSDESKSLMAVRYLVSKCVLQCALQRLCAEHAQALHNVTINSSNPGLCYSELIREMEKTWIIRTWFWLTARTAEVGARCLVDAGVAGPESHGKYMHDCKAQPAGPLILGTHSTEGIQGRELQNLVWDELKVKLEQIEPGVTKNV